MDRLSKKESCTMSSVVRRRGIHAGYIDVRLPRLRGPKCCVDKIEARLMTLPRLLVDASDETLHPALEEGRVDGHFRGVEWVLHHCVRVCLGVSSAISVWRSSGLIA